MCYRCPRKFHVQTAYKPSNVIFVVDRLNLKIYIQKYQWQDELFTAPCIFYRIQHFLLVFVYVLLQIDTNSVKMRLWCFYSEVMVNSKTGLLSQSDARTLNRPQWTSGNIEQIATIEPIRFMYLRKFTWKLTLNREETRIVDLAWVNHIWTYDICYGECPVNALPVSVTHPSSFMTCGWGLSVFITSSSDNKSFLSDSGALPV